MKSAPQSGSYCVRWNSPSTASSGAPHYLIDNTMGCVFPMVIQPTYCSTLLPRHATVCRVDNNWEGAAHFIKNVFFKKSQKIETERLSKFSNLVGDFNSILSASIAKREIDQKENKQQIFELGLVFVVHNLHFNG